MAKKNTFARVRALKPWPATCFAVALLYRMVPHYRLFAESIELDNAELLEKVLALVTEHLRQTGNKHAAKINFALQREKVESAAPDIANYDLFGVYLANDACMAMVALLNLLSAEDEAGAVVVSKLSQASVEVYLLHSQEVSEDTIADHPLMEFELAIQTELLDLLESSTSNSATFEQAIHIATVEPITNIGLAMDE